MLLTKATEGFLLSISTGNYSPETVSLYRFLLARIAVKLGDPHVETIKLEDLQTLFADLSEYSGAYQDNHWKCLRTFFAWAHETLHIDRPDDDLTRPKYKTAEIQPFTESEIKKLLAACDFTAPFARKNTREYRTRRPTALRDKMIILMLLDTGLRVGELCRLKIGDINLQTGETLVAPYSTGRKTRPRTVFLGVTTRKVLWLYLARLKDYDADDLLVDHAREMVRTILVRIGERAGVHGVTPHRFRHTFAVQFLRNGGDVFTLQRLLGHSSLDMVRRYLLLADADSQAAHKRASPADRWKL